MSKTDKTRPFPVKMLDRPQNYIELHDHRDGICDLPERPTVDNLSNCWWGSWPRKHCGYVWSPSFALSGEAQCGCRYCQAPWERRQKARRSRHDARRMADNLRKEFRAYKFDLQDW